MRRVLITGMSGTGKSSVIVALARRGFKAIDTDWSPQWERPNGDEWIWREDQIRRLLDEEDAETMFVSACVLRGVPAAPTMARRIPPLLTRRTFHTSCDACLNEVPDLEGIGQ